MLCQNGVQPLGGDGLGQVVIHAGFHAVFDILGKGVGGHGDDGNGFGLGMAAGTYGPGGIVAVHHGHLNIHEDGVKGAGRTGDKLISGGLTVGHHLQGDAHLF